MLISKAPLHISFAGEGTDLPYYYMRHEGIVIGTTIDKYVYAVAKPGHPGAIQILSCNVTDPNLIDYNNPYTNNVLSLPQAMFDHFNLHAGLSLFLAAELPVGLESATIVALLKGLGSWSGKYLLPAKLAQLAYDIQSQQPSTLTYKHDFYGVAFGGLNKIVFNAAGVQVIATPINPLVKRQLSQNLLLFDISMLDEQPVLQSSIDDMLLADIDWLHTRKMLALEMERALIQGDLPYFGHLLDAVWQYSRIAHPHLDRVYHEARKLGAAGGKFIPSGKNGFLLLYAEPMYQHNITWALHQQGLRVIRFAFDDEGATMVVDNRKLNGFAETLRL